MATAMHLHALPPELLRLILTSFDSLHDLYSLIQASSHCFRLYRITPELIVSSTLRRAIHPDALYHALAVGHIETYQITSSQNHEELWQFLDRYFQCDPTLLEFPREMDGVISLAKLNTMVSRLANDYICRTLQALYASEKTQQDTQQTILAPCSRHGTCQNELSATEQARLQRAFFRYELYSRCFPVNPRHVDSLFPADVQFNRFIQRMEPWEVEELSCLHEYFWVRISGIFSDVEEEIVVKVLEAQNAVAPAVKASEIEQPDTNPQLRAYTSIDGDNSMCLFEGLEFCDLDLFSEDERSSLPDTLRYLVSLGLPFLESLLFAQRLERRDLIRRHCLRERDFLPQAIYEDPNPAQASNNPEKASDDEICHANLGYHLFRPSSIEAYLSAMSIAGYWPLRRLGYVFWDLDRVIDPEINTKLRDARDCDPIVAKKAFDGLIKKSAEIRLKGIKLPKALMNKIRDDYRYIWDFDADDGPESEVEDSEEEDYRENA